MPCILTCSLEMYFIMYSIKMLQIIIIIIVKIIIFIVRARMTIIKIINKKLTIISVHMSVN